MASQPDGRAHSLDGVEIAYAARGAGRTSVVFIHGGLADRVFWKGQLDALGDRYRTTALDLAGHGESGRNRVAWTIPAFAADVAAVARALDLHRIVLVGNSLGGAVALEAVPLLRPDVLAVIGVDTLHDGSQVFSTAASRERAQAFRSDFTGSCRAMVQALFHSGAHPKLREWAERRMLATPVEVAAGLMDGYAGYSLTAAFRSAGVPIRAINGDLWPTMVESNRRLAPGFDAVIMRQAGHYPMLEQPAEFNRVLIDMIARLEADADGNARQAAPYPSR
jgi:sigma-B regulation protein RsbQ